MGKKSEWDAGITNYIGAASVGEAL